MQGRNAAGRADRPWRAHFEHAPQAGSEEAWIQALEVLIVWLGAARGLDPDAPHGLAKVTLAA